MQVSYRGGSPLYFWPNYSLASRASPDVELRPVLLLVRGDYPPFTFLLSAPFLRLSSSLFFLSLSLRFSVYLHVPSLVISLRWLRGVRYFPFFFFFSNHSTFPSLSLYTVAFLVPLSLCLVPLFSLCPVPSRSVVGKSGAADLLWNLYCYRAPQQWSQPPHFSTPDLCYRSGFLSSCHENLFCEVIRPCFSPHVIMYKEIICTRCPEYYVFLL